MKPTLRALVLSLLCPLFAAPLAACDPELDASASPPRSRLASRRALARAHAEGDVSERLAAGQQVLIEPGSWVDGAGEVHFVLLNGEAAPPTLAALAADPALGARGFRKVLVGGTDAAGPVVLDDVEVGVYTACGAAGPPRDPAAEALLADAVARYEAGTGGELSADRLVAAARAAQAAHGPMPPRIDAGALPLRCRTVEVTAAPASRVVALD